MQVVDRDLVVGADRDDLLREHVERIPRDDGLLDLAAPHSLRDHGRFEQVEPELGEDPALGDRAQLVTGTADPLQAAGDRLRRLDLDDEVDRAHVDAELERRGGDEARDLAALQQLLDLDALLARERAVVRAGDLLLGQLVQAQREPLGQAAVVDEHDRRAVLLDELQQLRVDRGPDRARRRPGAVRDVAAVHDLGPADRLGGGEVAHVLERDDDLEVELLRAAGVDELDRPRAGDEAPDLLERPLRRREPDPLERPAGRAGRGARGSARGARRASCRRRRAPRRRSPSRRERSISRPCDVSSRKSDSGVVIRMSGGLRSIACRSRAGVSPVRTADARAPSAARRAGRAGSARRRS